MELQNCMTDMLSTLASGFGDKALMLVDKDGTPAGHILGTEMVGAMEYEHNKHNRVPWGYTELEYIESGGTQWIDTGIVPDDTTGMKVTVQAFQITGKGNIPIGERPTSGNTRFWIDIDFAGTNAGDVLIGWDTAHPSSPTAYVRVGTNKATIEANMYNSRKAYINDVEYDIGTLPTLGAHSNHIFLFGANTAYMPSLYLFEGKIFSATITKGSNIIANYAPAKRNSDGVVGMYDLVSNTFLTNAGTGTFSYGEL